MNVFFEKENKNLTFEITEEIDHHKAELLRKELDYEIQRYMPRKVVFDFNKVSFMDSAGIGMVLGRYKMMKMLGGSIEIKNTNNSLKRIFEMSGINKICNIS